MEAVMAYAELIAAAYIGALGAFLNANRFWDRLLLKAPLFPASAFLLADALSRLGYL
jgi:hypothetical protein